MQTKSLRKNATNKYIVVFLCGSNLHVLKTQNNTIQYNRLCLTTMRIKATSLWSCNLLQLFPNETKELLGVCTQANKRHARHKRELTQDFQLNILKTKSSENCSLGKISMINVFLAKSTCCLSLTQQSCSVEVSIQKNAQNRWSWWASWFSLSLCVF